jgi:hypothetical protein
LADAKFESKNFFLHCLILSFFLAHIQDEEEEDGEEGEENLAQEEEESSKRSPQIFPNPFSSQSENPVASGMPDRSIHGSILRNDG